MVKQLFIVVVFVFGIFTHLLAKDSHEIKENQTNNDSLNIIHFNKMAYENLKKDPLSSFENATKALDLAEKNDIKPEILNALLLMGIVKKNFGRFDEAALYYFRALSIANTLDLKEKQSVCYNNIGSLYQTQNNYIKALEYFKKSLDIERLLNNKEQMSIRLYNMGVVYEAMDSLDIAYTYYFNSLLIEQELKNKEGEFYALYGISGIESLKGNYDKAMTSINKALEISKAIDDKNGISLCYSELGSLYKTIKDYSKAIIAYDSSIYYASIVMQKNTIRLAYKELSDIYNLKGNVNEAYKYLKLFTLINDTINNADISNKVAELEAGFQIEKRENEILQFKRSAELSEKVMKSEKRNKYFLLIAFILSIVLALSNLRRILPDGKNVLYFSVIIVLCLLLITYIINLTGIYSVNSSQYPFFYVFVDVLTIAILPVFVFVLMTERVMLKRNIRKANEISQQIKTLKTIDNKEMLSFEFESEKNKLTIPLKDFVCVEANDNYSAFYFYKGELITKELYRISLKSVEEQLSETTDIMRCHKSYIVNLLHINHISGNAQGYKLHFTALNFEIPVSRNFPKDILKKIKTRL